MLYDGNQELRRSSARIFSLWLRSFSDLPKHHRRWRSSDAANLRRHIDLSIREVPSGTRVFDWSIPPEWNIRDAFVKNADGKRVVDFRRSNLHVLNYSSPVHTKLPLEELKEHIFTLPDQPDSSPIEHPITRSAGVSVWRRISSLGCRGIYECP